MLKGLKVIVQRHYWEKKKQLRIKLQSLKGRSWILSSRIKNFFKRFMILKTNAGIQFKMRKIQLRKLLRKKTCRSNNWKAKETACFKSSNSFKNIKVKVFNKMIVLNLKAATISKIWVSTGMIAVRIFNKMKETKIKSINN
jgi:hypothetical protein